MAASFEIDDDFDDEALMQEVDKAVAQYESARTVTSSGVQSACHMPAVSMPSSFRAPMENLTNKGAAWQPSLQGGSSGRGSCSSQQPTLQSLWGSGGFKGRRKSKEGEIKHSFGCRQGEFRADGPKLKRCEQPEQEHSHAEGQGIAGKTPLAKEVPNGKRNSSEKKKVSSKKKRQISDGQYDEATPTGLIASSVGKEEDKPAWDLTSGLNDSHEFDKIAGARWIYPVSSARPKREYQFRIAEKALLSNTIVCLPTGLGKTLIAAVVMLNFFRWFPKGKIVFLAPTKPLVGQQMEACHGIAGIPQEAMACMTGATPVEQRAEYWRNRRVFFMTGQTLQNDIQEHGICPKEAIVCLVVDEAHRACGKYAYGVVVDELLKAGVRFRVLALTATPGSCHEKVQEVINSLHISCLELRGEKDSDVREYTFARVEELKKVPVLAGTREIEALLREELRIHTTFLAKWVDSRIPPQAHSFMIQSKKTAFEQRRAEQGGFQENDQHILWAFANAQFLAHVAETLVVYGVGSALKKMEENKDGRVKLDSPQMVEAQKRMLRVMAKGLSSPKLGELETVIISHFKRKGPDNTKVIVFTNLRESVVEIVEVLNARQADGVKAKEFIGQQSGKTKGMPQKQQLKTVQEFRKGEFNVLVATSIGEEGLDISQVDLVVAFDCMSVGRMTQRMGRTGRQREGKVIILASEGAELRKYKTEKKKGEALAKNIRFQGAELLQFHPSPRMVPHKCITPEPSEEEIRIDQWGCGSAKRRRKLLKEPKTGGKARKQRKLSEGVLEQYNNNQRCSGSSQGGRMPEDIDDQDGSSPATGSAVEEGAKASLVHHWEEYDYWGHDGNSLVVGGDAQVWEGEGQDGRSSVQPGTSRVAQGLSETPRAAEVEGNRGNSVEEESGDGLGTVEGAQALVDGMENAGVERRAKETGVEGGSGDGGERGQGEENLEEEGWDEGSEDEEDGGEGGWVVEEGGIEEEEDSEGEGEQGRAESQEDEGKEQRDAEGDAEATRDMAAGRQGMQQGGQRQTQGCLQGAWKPPSSEEPLPDNSKFTGSGCGQSNRSLGCPMPAQGPGRRESPNGGLPAGRSGCSPDYCRQQAASGFKDRDLPGVPLLAGKGEGPRSGIVTNPPSHGLQGGMPFATPSGMSPTSWMRRCQLSNGQPLQEKKAEGPPQLPHSCIGSETDQGSPTLVATGPTHSVLGHRSELYISGKENQPPAPEKLSPCGVCPPLDCIQSARLNTVAHAGTPTRQEREIHDTMVGTPDWDTPSYETRDCSSERDGDEDEFVPASPLTDDERQRTRPGSSLKGWPIFSTISPVVPKTLAERFSNVSGPQPPIRARQLAGEKGGLPVPLNTRPSAINHDPVTEVQLIARAEIEAGGKVSPCRQLSERTPSSASDSPRQNKAACRERKRQNRRSAKGLAGRKLSVCGSDGMGAEVRSMRSSQEWQPGQEGGTSAEAGTPLAKPRKLKRLRKAAVEAEDGPERTPQGQGFGQEAGERPGGRQQQRKRRRGPAFIDEEAEEDSEDVEGLSDDEAGEGEEDEDEDLEGFIVDGSGDEGRTTSSAERGAGSKENSPESADQMAMYRRSLLTQFSGDASPRGDKTEAAGRLRVPRFEASPLMFGNRNANKMRYLPRGFDAGGNMWAGAEAELAEGYESPSTEEEEGTGAEEDKYARDQFDGGEERAHGGEDGYERMNGGEMDRKAMEWFEDERHKRTVDDKGLQEQSGGAEQLPGHKEKEGSASISVRFDMVQEGASKAGVPPLCGTEVYGFEEEDEWLAAQDLDEMEKMAMTQIESRKQQHQVSSQEANTLSTNGSQGAMGNGSNVRTQELSHLIGQPWVNLSQDNGQQRPLGSLTQGPLNPQLKGTGLPGLRPLLRPWLAK